MFCVSCGTQLPEGAKFCMKCGDSVGRAGESDNSESISNPKLIPAKCTSCGAALKVDASQQAAICPFCNSAYIVEQAINNYNISVNGDLNVENATININGIDSDNLLLRAKEFEQKGEYETALDYYNQVLDADALKQEAREGVERVKKIIFDYVYFESPANRSFTAGKLQLKRDRLLFIDRKEKETVYELRWLKNLQLSIGGFEFIYGENPSKISFICKGKGPEWIQLISNGADGIYPTMYKPEANGIENYIKSNFNSRSKVMAIKYYSDMTGASLSEAKKKVDELL